MGRSVHDLEVESLYAKVTRNVRESPAGHSETDVEFDGNNSGGEGHREKDSCQTEDNGEAPTPAAPKNRNSHYQQQEQEKGK